MKLIIIEKNLFLQKLAKNRHFSKNHQHFRRNEKTLLVLNIYVKKCARKHFKSLLSPFCDHQRPFCGSGLHGYFTGPLMHYE